MITINSKDRTSLSSSSSDFILKRNLETDVSGFRVSYIQLPYAWYNITSTSNSIRINGTNTVSITPGQYTASSLASALQTALQVVDATFTVTYSTTTGKFTITRNLGFTLNLSSSLFTMRRQLGFNSTSDTASNTSHTSDSVVNIHNGNSISLHSNLLGKALRNRISDSRSDYVLSIPITGNPGNLLYYAPGQDIVYKFDRPIHFEGDISFQLKDVDNNVLDMNGVNWEMGLVIF